MRLIPETIRREFGNAPIKTAAAVIGIIASPFVIWAVFQIPNLFPEFQTYNIEITYHNPEKILGTGDYNYNISVKNTGTETLNDVILVWAYFQNPYPGGEMIQGQETFVKECVRMYSDSCSCHFDKLEVGETGNCFLHSYSLAVETLLATGRSYPVTLGFCSQEICKSKSYTVIVK